MPPVADTPMSPQRFCSVRNVSAVCTAAPLGLRPRVMPMVPGRILLTFFNDGTTLARIELPPRSRPPKSAPPTVPTPPTTASRTTGRLCVKS